MECKDYKEWLPDFLARALPADRTKSLEAHIAGCEDCRSEVELWQKLSLLPVERPSQRVRANFERMMEDFQHQQAKQLAEKQKHEAHGYWSPVLGGLTFRPNFAHAALALIMLVSGFQLGRTFNFGQSNNNQQIADLQQQLVQTQQMVALSMMQQDSASERLEGVGYSLKVKSADPQLIAALLHTLRFDESVDVRLAAIDALHRYRDQPVVHKGLMDALGKQKSPLVQIAVIDAMVDMKDKNAVKPLEELQHMRDVNPLVRKHTEWAIQQLNKGL